MSTLFKRLRDGFRDKEYRDAYAESFSDSKIATQIKVLREQRGWTQQQLAEAAGMKQSRIAALEDVNYSSWSLRTLRRLAQAFDVWLDVEFREFGTVWTALRDFSRASLVRRPFPDDPVFSATTDTSLTTTTATTVITLNEGVMSSSQPGLSPLTVFTTGRLFTFSGSETGSVSSGSMIVSSGTALTMARIDQPGDTETFDQPSLESDLSIDPLYWQEDLVA